MHWMCVLPNAYNHNSLLWNFAETCQTIEENSQNEPHSFLPLEKVYKPTDISAFASVIRPTLSRTHVFANAYQLTRSTTNRAYNVRNRGQLSAMYTHV